MIAGCVSWKTRYEDSKTRCFAACEKRRALCSFYRERGTTIGDGDIIIVRARVEEYIQLYYYITEGCDMRVFLACIIYIYMYTIIR